MLGSRWRIGRSLLWVSSRGPQEGKTIQELDRATWAVEKATIGVSELQRMGHVDA